MKKLGMVIVNYNDYKTTSILLDNIKNYKCLDLIVVVDNNSSDDSLKYLSNYENEKIIILNSRTNNGYASGLNLGAKYIIKKLGNCNIIFSNSDVIIDKESDLKKLSNDINQKIALVGPTIKEKNNLNRGWKMPTIKDEIKFNLPLINRKYHKDNLYNDSYYMGNVSLVDVVSGCFFLVDAQVLKKVDFFDENTFLYYEEQILAKKLININKKEAVDNNVFVIHNHSVTIDNNINRLKKYKILKTSQRYFAVKYLGASGRNLWLLDFTNRLSLAGLYIRCLLKGGLKK